MPTTHQCQNYATCKGYADGNETLCQYCREIEKRERLAKATRWLWAGFDKSTDNHRHGYRKGSHKP